MMAVPVPRVHWQGCPCVPDVEGLHCQTCGIRLPAASRKRSIDTAEGGSLVAQNNEGRVSAANAPSPLDALGAP